MIPTITLKAHNHIIMVAGFADKRVCIWWLDEVLGEE